MAYYKAKEVMEAANAEDVASALGLEIRNKSGRKSILCPGHLSYLGKADNHFGNAVLSDKGYYCFGCNCYSNVFNMAMQVTGCTFPEAVKFVADTTGRSFTDYSDEQKKEEKPAMALSRHDLELLGLATQNHTYCITKSVDMAEAKKKEMRTVPKSYLGHFKTDEYETLAYENKAYDSLQALLKEDKELYIAIVSGKAKEAIDKRKFILQMLEDDDDNLLLIFVHPEYKNALINDLKTDLWELERIVKKVKEL